MSTHFFTGYPGFLGRQLVPRILEADPAAAAVCLVQEKYLETAQAAVEELRLGTPSVARRIRLVVGDLTRPDLGLDPSKLEQLAASATAVWHLAAVYDLSVDRELAVRVNVDGTLRVLELAGRCRLAERFHYLSTCYVSGRYVGIFSEDDLEKGQSFNNAYEETKHRAEVEVRRAMADGLPATVYRPAIVVGDSRTGATQKYDGPYSVIRWVLRQPWTAIVPVVGDPRATRVNLVPSDYVIEAIAHLSRLPHAVGRTYQLADPEPLTVAELLDVIGEAAGKKVRPLRVPGGLARWVLDRVPGAQRLIGIPAAAVDYFSLPTHYATFRARTDLEGSGLQVPPFRSYARELVEFMKGHPEIGSRGMA